MAFRTYLYPYIRLGRTGMNRLTTGADNCAFFVVGMNFFFHFSLLNERVIYEHARVRKSYARISSSVR